jgi:hypothetical protein
MRFEERELKPYAEPVSHEEFKEDRRTEHQLGPLHCETVRYTFPGSQDSKWKSRFRGIHL